VRSEAKKHANKENGRKGGLVKNGKKTIAAPDCSPAATRARKNVNAELNCHFPADYGCPSFDELFYFSRPV
jgi:hypothetical protein